MYLIVYLLYAEPVMSLYFSGDAQWRLLASLFLNLVLGPLSSIWLLKRQGVVDDLSMPRQKGRSLVYLVVAGWYALTYGLLYKLQLPLMVQALFAGLILCLLGLALFNRWTKLSAHVAAMGGCLAVVTWMMAYYDMWHPWHWLTWTLIVALVASMRLYLQVHSMRQVAYGFLLGFFSLSLSLWILVP